MSIEASFQSAVLKYLNGLPGCRAENVSGNANQSGRPDINGCYNGRAFKIELKSEDTGYKPSKKQELELRRWKNVGCVVGILYDMQSVRNLFEFENWFSTKPIDRWCSDNDSWYSIPLWGGK